MPLMRALLLVLLTLGLGLSSLAKAAPSQAETPPPCHQMMERAPDQAHDAGVAAGAGGAPEDSTEIPTRHDQLMNCCIGCAPGPVHFTGALLGASARIEPLLVFQTATLRLVGLAVPPEPGRPRRLA